MSTLQQVLAYFQVWEQLSKDQAVNIDLGEELESLQYKLTDFAVYDKVNELEEEYEVTDKAKKAASKAIDELQKKIKESL